MPNPHLESLFSANTPDRLELLKTFVRIVESGSLSAAASQLNTTQPTISRRLKTLEHVFGVRLLHRSTHHLRLSEAGERCYAGAKQFLEQWSIFEADLTGIDREPEGLLRIIAPHAFGQDVLVEPLADFMRSHPKVTVEWLLHDDRGIRDFISEGIDCAIQVGEVLDPAMVRIRLAEIPRILIGSPKLFAERPLPQHPDDLKTLPWLALQTFYRTQITLRHVTGYPHLQQSITPIFSTDSLYALRSAAVKGLGIGIGSSWLMNQDIVAGRLVQLLPEWEADPLPVYLVYPYAKYYPAKLRRFIALMRENMPAIIRSATD